MPADRGMQQQINALLAGRRQGFYTLPEPLLLAEVGMAKFNVDRARLGAIRSQAEVGSVLIEEMIERFLAGEAPPPDTTERLDRARLARQRWDDGVRLFADAEERLVLRFGTLVNDECDEIIADHLHPAVEEVLAKAAPQAERLAGAITAAEVVTKGAAAGKSWLVLSELAIRLQRVRDAWELLRRLVFASDLVSDASEFCWLKNMEVVYPAFNAQYKTAPPWPDEAPAYLAWCCTSAAEPWLPTPDQLNERVVEWGAAERVKNNFFPADREAALGYFGVG